MGSALLDNFSETSRDGAAHPGAFRALEPSPEFSTTDLRRHAAERLAAHRNRRAGDTPATDGQRSPMPRNTRSARIAATVAERYAHTQSYHDFLAAEAERAVQQARAAAEVAARNARALAAAHQDLLRNTTEELVRFEAEARAADAADVDSEPSPTVAAAASNSSVMASLWPELETASPHPAAGQSGADTRRFHPPAPRAKQVRQPRRQAEDIQAAPEPLSAAPEPSGSAQMLAAGITIRLYQDESGATKITLDPPAPPLIASSAFGRSRSELSGPEMVEQARLLDEEIAFRHQPEFEEPAGPPEPLPANLIEFPRQLVAARKARPRLAEGPLREDSADEQGVGQLRIFEVEPEQIATAPESDAVAAADSSAQWTTIWLDSQPHPEQLQPDAAGDIAGKTSAAASGRSSAGLPNVASVRRRVLAAGMNTAILGATFAGFAAIALWIAGHLPGHGAAPLSVEAEAGAFLNRAALQATLPFAVCAFALLAAIYQALFFSLSTATPGMRAAHIALCTFRDENPSRAAIRRRLLALLLSGVPMCLGFLWAMLDEERLSWHDRICGIYQRSY